jgi:uncharacterized protein (DUF1684 family)
MHSRDLRAAVLCLAGGFSLLACPLLGQDSAYQRDLQAWRDRYVRELTKPDGWLSLAGLEWLAPGDNPFGSAADNKIRLPLNAPAHLGVLRLEGQVVTLHPPAGGFPRDLLVDGKQAAPQQLPFEPDRGDQGNPRLTIGSLQMYVVERGGRFALRIKDAQAATLVHFAGLNWFSPNEEYRFVAAWVPYNPPKSLTLLTLIGSTYTRPVYGAAAFGFRGKTFRLEPIVDDEGESRLHFVIRDTTSSSTTYPACRFLYTGFPSNGLDKPGELVLDFNHLENPPCAYTPYATCPLPPPGNRLPIALPVGEKRYHD